MQRSESYFNQPSVIRNLRIYKTEGSNALDVKIDYNEANFRNRFASIPDVHSRLQRRGLHPMGVQVAEDISKKEKPVSNTSKILTIADLQRIRRSRESAGVKIQAHENGKEHIQIGYDIDADVLNMEKAANDTEKEQHAKEVGKNLEFMLFERFGASCMPRYKHPIVNGHIYSTEQNKYFYEMFKFGVEVLKDRGSQATRRELLEVQEAQLEDEILTQEAGIIRIVFSPPYEQYTDKFIDIKISKRDVQTGGLYVEARRYKSEQLTSQMYDQIATIFDPEYLKKYEHARKSSGFMNNITKEEYFPGNGITMTEKAKEKYGKTTDEIFFNLLGEIDPEKQIKIQTVVQQCKELMTAYVTTLQIGSFNTKEAWITLAQTFNAILSYSEALYNRSESVLYRATTWIVDQSKIVFSQQQQQAAAAVMHKVSFWAKQAVSTVLSGCGYTAGLEVQEDGSHRFTIERFMNIKNPKNLLKNIFNKDTKADVKKWFECPRCPYKATGPIGNECPGCHLTMEEAPALGFAVCA